MRIHPLFLLFAFIAVAVSAGVFATHVSAQGNVAELQAKIDERNNQIKSLEAEIETYNREADRANREARSLQNTIRTLDVTQKKVDTDLTLTERRISKTDLTINELGINIRTTGEQIETNTEVIKSLIQQMHRTEDQSAVEVFLQYKTFTELWDNLETLKQVKKQIKFKTDELSDLRVDMTEKKIRSEQEQGRLRLLHQNLEDQKKIVEYNRQEKAKVLAQTKNTEAAYKALLKEKEAQKNAFEKELFEYESQLKLDVDPTRLPDSRPGVLAWPLDKIIVTQRFGRTVAARRLYTSGSHNGVDFGAVTGTPVKSAARGVVVGTGDTDQFRGCYSFGKWVMVKHPNGLSTIYAHLSVIRATEGQEVATGEVIGYSGNTGYSTGPHLHFGVYATQGVRIEKHVNSRACKQARMPLADIKAYLDPFEYLPEL